MPKFTEKYINPFTDYGFKKLFGTEFNKALLIDFINQVLGNREQIHTLSYLNIENIGNTEVQLMDKQTHEIFYDKFTFIYLEIPKFGKQEDKLETTFDKWMYVLKNLPKLQERPKKLQEKIFEKLFEEAEIAKLNPEDMNAYEQSLKIYRDNRSIVEYAKHQGREEGRREERIAIAKMLKKNGVAVELIEKSTGLTQEQVENLE